MPVTIEKISILRDHYSVQPQPVSFDRDLHQALESLVLATYQPPVVRSSELVGVMLYRLLLRHSECRRKIFLTHKAGVFAECPQLRQIPLNEEFQLPVPHENRSVGDYSLQPAFIVLVAAKLRLAIVLSGNDERFQVQSVPKHFHLRIQPDLPF